MEMKFQPDYEKLHLWELYAQQLDIEYEQSVEEGKDIEQYRKLFESVQEMPLDEKKVRMADILFEIVMQAPQREGYAYVEPSDLEGIKRCRPASEPVRGEVKKEELRDKLCGAWVGRICGCLLGKPIEGIRTEALLPLLKRSGNYPMERYIRSTDIWPELKEQYSFYKEAETRRCYGDQVSYMPFDDDTNYVVLALKVIEKYGKDFTPFDMSQEWMALQPKVAYCTAERVAFCNFVKGLTPPESALYHNPYREWIGAQIRGDYFGYINPGNPEFAAELAWRDASISHVKNGIYGEMMVAAMLASAAVTEDMEAIIRSGIAQIPEKSRLYESVKKVLDWYTCGVGQEECFARIHQEWDEHTDHGWCHTISNAMIVAAALLYGNGDYGKSIGMAVQTGFDTDCNGATVGSVLGMRNGISGISEEWSAPIQGTLETTIFGMGKVSIEEMVDITMKHAGL